MKIFGREPAVWIGLIEAVLAFALAVGLDWSNEQVALVMAAVVAVFGVVTAYATRDTMLGYVVGLTKAVIALFIGFGVDVSAELTASMIGLITVGVGFYQRTQTTPLAEGSFAQREDYAQVA